MVQIATSCASSDAHEFGGDVGFDLDGLDPAYAPGVSHHEPGGLSVRELMDLLARVSGPVIGADLVEYNPDRDVHEMTCSVAAKLVKELAAIASRSGRE